MHTVYILCIKLFPNGCNGNTYKMKKKPKIYHTVWTDPKYTTLCEQIQNIPHCVNRSKIYHTVWTDPKSNWQIIETKTNSIPLITHIHDRSLSWLGTGTSNIWVKLVLWTQICPFTVKGATCFLILFTMTALGCVFSFLYRNMT